MGMISAEEAKIKLSEWNVLIKYMNFLQANGFTDCGKGQILGQVSLIRECLGDNIIFDGENTIGAREKEDMPREGIQRPENGAENDLSPNLKEEASEGGSGLLKQVSNLVSDGLKEEVQLVASRKDESLSGEFRQLADDSAISVDKPRGLVSRRTEALVTKELNGSWLDKIKRITEIEEWR
jgi:hypothetical protein